MPLAITHTFVSAKTDGSDNTLVQPSNWNAQHTITGSASVAQGGTGLTSYTTGDMLFYNTGTALSQVAIGAANTILTSTSAAPQWSTPATVAGNLQGTGISSATAEVGFRGIPQVSTGISRTTVASDNGKHIYITAGSTIQTIDSNANVAYPIGAAITFIAAGGSATIAITSDTMTLSPDGTTGSRTLAQHGIATAIKVTATAWYISGTGLT